MTQTKQFKMNKTTKRTIKRWKATGYKGSYTAEITADTKDDMDEGTRIQIECVKAREANRLSKYLMPHVRQFYKLGLQHKQRITEVDFEEDAPAL